MAGAVIIMTMTVLRLFCVGKAGIIGDSRGGVIRSGNIEYEAYYFNMSKLHVLFFLFIKFIDL